jgi:hypothetical protein
MRPPMAPRPITATVVISPSPHPRSPGAARRAGRGPDGVAGGGRDAPAGCVLAMTFLPSDTYVRLRSLERTSKFR